MGALEDLVDAVGAAAVAGLAANDRPAASPVVYNGPFTPGPASCCQQAGEPGTDGFIAVYWTRAYASSRYPLPLLPADAAAGGPTPPAVDVWLRLWRCFPTVDEAGRFDLDAATAATGGLLADLEAVWKAMTAAICGNQFSEVVPGCSNVILWDVTPLRPQGGCSGWAMHLTARWNSQAVAP